jgi:hypothetical protein
MDDASKGKFAVGNLGRVLIEQEEQMRSLIEKLNGTERRGEAGLEANVAAALVHETEAEIIAMKQEQQKLLKELLESSNIHVPEYTTTSTHVETFAASFIDSLGVHQPSSNGSSGLLSSPSKPANARELRRQKNAAAPDLGKNETLVNEIQQQLINEVRRLQALISERDKALARLTEATEEADRIKVLHEATIKRLESEKDSQDANLYELERREELLREENEDITKQLKKHENDLRLLKRQLAEKADIAESFKASNEELEQRVDDLRSNVATMKAKGIADQKTISGLKVQVSDLETKHVQAMEKIPASMSVASRLSSSMHGSSFDATQTAGDYGNGPDSPMGQKTGSHALAPTVSIDDDMSNRLRSSDVVRGMESDIAKWRTAAMKYRKKWNDVRRQSVADGRTLEHDDSTDEDDENEAVWLDDNAAGKGDKKRGATRGSRNVSAGSRRSGKTMGDAFGLINRMVSSGSGHVRNGSWQSHDLDASINEDDDSSSIAASSTRGSIDGFDPNFADPTIRGANSRDTQRRSTILASQVGKASPLTRQLHLTDDLSLGADDSGQSHDTHAGSIIHPVGALGDELNAVQTEDDSVYVDTGDKEQERLTAALEAEAERHDAALRSALAERDAAMQVALAERDAALQSALEERDAAHSSGLLSLRDEHAKALSLKDTAFAEQLNALQNEHHANVALLKQQHAQSFESALQKHQQALQQRGIEHDQLLAQTERQHASKLNEHSQRHAKMHEDSMAEARQRHTEALSRQREETQSALLAAQREHRVLVEERDALHAEAIKRLNASHERELIHRDQEHQGMLEDVQATHESFVRQRDAIYSTHLTQRDELIKAKDEELADLQAQLANLRQEIDDLREQLRNAKTSLQIATQEVEKLQASAATNAQEVQTGGEEFQDANEATEAEAAALNRLDNSSQTERVETPVAVVEAPTGDAEVVKGTEKHIASAPTVLPLPEMPPPPPLAATLARTRGESIAPRRPMSPPPADLIARSGKSPAVHVTSPVVSVSEVMQNAQRPSSRLASGPPPSSFTPATLGRRSNTPSLLRMRTTSQDAMRREAGTSSRMQHQQHTARAPSAQSFVSDATSDMLSGRTSQASYYMDGANTTMGTSNLGHGHGRRASALGGVADQMTTDPAVLGSITQAMIGSYLWKYTRRGMGRANVRHKRYFWVHPYTRTLYWTLQAPNEAVSSSEVTNKSAFIQDVMVVEDDNNSPANLYHLSIVVSTLHRDVKMTAADRAQHDLWVTALGYLVNRELPSETRQAPSEWRQSITKASMTKLRSRATGSSVNVSGRASVTPMSPSKSTSTVVDHSKTPSAADASSLSVDRTPRARASTGVYQSSLLHRRDTAAKEYLEQWESLKGQAAQRINEVSAQSAYDHTTPRATSSMSRRSATTRGGSLAKDMFGSARNAAMHHANGSRASVSTTDTSRFMSAEQMLEQDAERFGYEGLDNVRACCDGKHDVGALAHRQYERQQQVERLNRRGSVGATARSTTPGLMQRVTTRASKGPLRGAQEAATSAALNDSAPQLGPLNINVLDASTITAVDRNSSTVDTPVDAKRATAGNKLSSSHESADWHSASEFGSYDPVNTPGSSQTRHAAGTAKGSYIDRITQIRRNRASASIR